MTLDEDTADHGGGPKKPPLYVIKLTAPGDPLRIIGYAMAEQIDFVPNRSDLLGVAKEALQAAEQTFARNKTFLDAVAIAPSKPFGDKIFARIGSGENNA